MIQNITGVVFIIFHIICCVLVWTGINSHLLKVKRYLILPVIFVPVWGMICVLLLHFQIFFHQDKKREIGIEKMKINEEIYRSIIAPKEESDRNIVPLEEVLLIDEAAMRRENQMQTKEYEQVLKSLERMDKKWHRNEEYWILRIRYYVELKQGKELKETLEQIQQEHIYLSAKGKEALAFWQE